MIYPYATAEEQADSLRRVMADWSDPDPSTLSKKPINVAKDGPKSRCPECGTWAARHQHLDFMGHASVTRVLNEIDPLWSWEPAARNDQGEPLIVTRGSMLRMWITFTLCGKQVPAVGTCESNKGEAEKELIGDAIRNAAMRFGIGLSLWHKGQWAEFDHDQPEAEPSVMPPSPDVVARLMGRLRDHDRDRMAVLFAERGWPKVAAMSAGQVAEVIGVLDELEASGTAQGAEPAVQDTGVLPSEAAPVGEVAGSAPATSPEPAADVSPAMSAAQSKRLHALLRAKRGIAGPARHRVLSELVGREIGSAKDLTAGEASAAIDVLAGEADLPPVDGPEEAA